MAEATVVTGTRKLWAVGRAVLRGLRKSLEAGRGGARIIGAECSSDLFQVLCFKLPPTLGTWHPQDTTAIAVDLEPLLVVGVHVLLCRVGHTLGRTTSVNENRLQARINM